MLSVEGLSGSRMEDSLLDVTSLSEGQVIRAIAYVQNCTVKTSKATLQPFVTFVLKDCHAVPIVARLFNPNNSMNLAQAFIRRPVKFKAEVQVFNGSYSLIIDGDVGVTVYSGEFDYPAFVGTYDVDLRNAAQICDKVLTDKYPFGMYAQLSVDFLGSGKVGAFAKIYDSALMNLLSLDGINGIEDSELLKVFFMTMHHYFHILSHYNKFGPLEKIKLLEEYNNVQCDDPNLRYILLDTLRSICENTKPLHLYANLIYNSIMQANKTLQLIEANNTLVAGANTQVYFTDLLGNSISGGVELLNY